MTIVTLQAVDLTPYGKPAFGRLPTWLGKPAAGFPQLHSLDDDVHNLSNSGLTPYRGTDADGPMPFMAPLRNLNGANKRHLSFQSGLGKSRRLQSQRFAHRFR